MCVGGGGQHLSLLSFGVVDSVCVLFLSRSVADVAAMSKWSPYFLARSKLEKIRSPLRTGTVGMIFYGGTVI